MSLPAPPGTPAPPPEEEQLEAIDMVHRLLDLTGKMLEQYKKDGTEGEIGMNIIDPNTESRVYGLDLDDGNKISMVFESRRDHENPILLYGTDTKSVEFGKDKEFDCRAEFATNHANLKASLDKLKLQQTRNPFGLCPMDEVDKDPSLTVSTFVHWSTTVPDTGWITLPIRFIWTIPREHRDARRLFINLVNSTLQAHIDTASQMMTSWVMLEPGRAVRWIQHSNENWEVSIHLLLSTSADSVSIPLWGTMKSYLSDERCSFTDGLDLIHAYISNVQYLKRNFNDNRGKHRVKPLGNGYLEIESEGTPEVGLCVGMLQSRSQKVEVFPIYRVRVKMDMLKELAQHATASNGVSSESTNGHGSIG